MRTTVKIHSQYFLTIQFASYILDADVKDVYLVNLLQDFEEEDLLEAFEIQKELVEEYKGEYNCTLGEDDETRGDDYEIGLANFIIESLKKGALSSMKELYKEMEITGELNSIFTMDEETCASISEFCEANGLPSKTLTLEVWNDKRTEILGSLISIISEPYEGVEGKASVRCWNEQEAESILDNYLEDNYQNWGRKESHFESNGKYYFKLVV